MAMEIPPVSGDNGDSSKPGFRVLPREIRDEIYGYYFTLEDGYTFNSKTKKLHPTCKLKNSLALTLANKQINQETQGLALERNTLHFATSFALETSDTLGMFDYLLKYISTTQSRLLLRLIAKSNWVACQAYAHVEKHYPRFLPIVNHARDGNYDDLSADNKCWKETPSIARAFVQETLHSVVGHEKFPKLPARDLGPSMEHFTVANAHFEAWRVPTKDEVENLAFRTHQIPSAEALSARAPVHPDSDDFDRIKFWNGEKHRSSAASLAIQFIQSLEETSRVKIRSVVLNEDQISVAWPESHGRGFIPICQENPQIRIKRRVNLWGNAVLASCSDEFPLINLMTPDHSDHGSPASERLHAGLISHKCFAQWLMEANALADLGMPGGCLELFLDGDPIPGPTAELFKITLMDAAWQLAYEDFNRTAVPDGGLLVDERWPTCYVMHGYPQALQDIINGTSIVKCTFDTGSMPDWTVVRQTNAQLSRLGWVEKWRNDHQDVILSTETPLPSWLDLRREEHLRFRVSYNAKKKLWETRPDQGRRNYHPSAAARERVRIGAHNEVETQVLLQNVAARAFPNRTARPISRVRRERDERRRREGSQAVVQP